MSENDATKGIAIDPIIPPKPALAKATKNTANPATQKTELSTDLSHYFFLNTQMLKLLLFFGLAISTLVNCV